MDRLVEVSEQEIRIDFVPNCKCRANVILRSLCSSSPIAFKVQTSSPHKFLVNPPSGLVSSFSQITLQIILKPQNQVPPTFPRSHSDRFLIRTAQFDCESGESIHADSLNSWLSTRRTQDIKLKVAFVGSFLLQHAVGCGDLDAVRSIIKRQKSILYDLSPKESEFILRVATQLDDSEDMVNLLLEAGLRVDGGAETTDGTSFYAVDSRRESGGWRELHAATPDGDQRTLKMLMEMRLEPTSANDHGRRALEVARDKRHVEIAGILHNGEEVLNAARHGELRYLELLVRKGAVVEYCDQYGLTALHAAAIKGHKDVVEMLVGFGLDLECQDNEGHTALHLAVEGGHKELVEALVRMGANLNAKSERGSTPLYLANTMGYDDISEFLKQRGACSSLPTSSPSSFASIS